MIDQNIRIIHRARARRIIMRYRADGSITVTVPSGMPESEWEPIASELIEKIREKNTLNRDQLYSDGLTLECGHFTFRFAEHSEPGRGIIARRYGSVITIAKHASLQWGSPTTEKSISQLLIVVAKSIAPVVLLPEAIELAKRHGVDVAEWKIGHGHKTLGSCRTDGRISLSAINVFLPRHLREYVICHELAHRSEMNHSNCFHEKLNHYLCGREAQLVNELRRFKWPIIR